MDEVMTSKTIITKRPETRELIVERALSAPAERLWRAWTEPEHIEQWWGPKGWTATIHEMDVRPEGLWRYELSPNDGHGETARGIATYREINAPTLLTFTDRFADMNWGPVPGSEMETVVTIDEDEAAAHTILKITTQFTTVEELANAEALGMVEGLSDALDRLTIKLDNER